MNEWGGNEDVDLGYNCLGAGELLLSHQGNDDDALGEEDLAILSKG